MDDEITCPQSQMVSGKWQDQDSNPENLASEFMLTTALFTLKTRELIVRRVRCLEPIVKCVCMYVCVHVFLTSDIF